MEIAEIASLSLKLWERGACYTAGNLFGSCLSCFFLRCEPIKLFSINFFLLLRHYLRSSRYFLTNIAALIVVLAIYIFTRSHKQIDFDSLMMFNIKNRLALLNKEENENRNNNPRFEWSCNKEATWIAIKIL